MRVAVLIRILRRAYCGSPQKMKAVGEISCGLLHKWRDKFLHIGNKDGFYFFFIAVTDSIEGILAAIDK